MKRSSFIARARKAETRESRLDVMPVRRAWTQSTRTPTTGVRSRLKKRHRVGKTAVWRFCCMNWRFRFVKKKTTNRLNRFCGAHLPFRNTWQSPIITSQRRSWIRWAICSKARINWMTQSASNEPPCGLRKRSLGPKARIWP